MNINLGTQRRCMMTKLDEARLSAIKFLEHATVNISFPDQIRLDSARVILDHYYDLQVLKKRDK
jgi:hypothetical protein